MKYFVQVKFRELQMTPQKPRISKKKFILIIFRILHFSPQIFQIHPNKFTKKL